MSQDREQAASDLGRPTRSYVRGKYRVIGELARGGMSILYLAATRRPGAPGNALVVLKELRPELLADRLVVAMFVEEGRVAACLRHPNIVRTFESGEEHERNFIAMEYLDGQCLHQVVSRARKVGRPVPLALLGAVLCHVLEGLAYAHAACDRDGKPLGIVHRDMSPHNVFVGYDGHVKILDFGIAKTLDSAVNTRTGILKGKVPYMSPEQAAGGRLDGRSDLFAVGVMLWEAATGRRFWSGMSNDTQILRALWQGQLGPGHETGLAEVPEPLRAVISRATAFEPSHRYAGAAPFVADLRAALIASGAAPASAPDIGRVVQELFGEERARLRAAIETALGTTGPTHAAENAAGEEAAADLTAAWPAVPSSVPPPPSVRPAALSAAAPSSAAPPSARPSAAPPLGTFPLGAPSLAASSLSASSLSASSLSASSLSASSLSASSLAASPPGSPSPAATPWPTTIPGLAPAHARPATSAGAGATGAIGVPSSPPPGFSVPPPAPPSGPGSAELLVAAEELGLALSRLQESERVAALPQSVQTIARAVRTLAPEGEPAAALETLSDCMQVLEDVDHWRTAVVAHLRATEVSAPPPALVLEAVPPPPAPASLFGGRLRKLSPRASIAIALAGSLVAGVVLGALLRSPASEPAAAAQAPARSPRATPSTPTAPTAMASAGALAAEMAVAPARSAVDRVHVIVRATPGNARIAIDRQLACENPCVATLPKDGAAHVAHIEADGYVPEDHAFEASADTTFILSLEPRRTSTHATTAPQRAPVAPSAPSAPSGASATTVPAGASLANGAGPPSKSAFAVQACKSE